MLYIKFKIMKKLINYTFVTGFLFLIDLSAFAGRHCVPGGGGSGGGGGETGAPLDGGLLAILAAAGISYYAVRKKKKNKE